MISATRKAFQSNYYQGGNTYEILALRRKHLRPLNAKAHLLHLNIVSPRAHTTRTFAHDAVQYPCMKKGEVAILEDDFMRGVEAAATERMPVTGCHYIKAPLCGAHLGA